MLSVVLYGRNDNYGYNLAKRAALSLNCIAEILRDSDDEILFVDYNTPDDYPTFPEAIQDTLTSPARQRLRILRVRPFVHERYKARTRLLALEPIARNIAIRRSRPSNRWILSTNTDMIFVLQRAGSLTDLVRDLPKGFYHAPRIELPETLWESLDRQRPKEVIETVRRWGWTLHLNEIVYGNEVIRYDGPGDFQLIEREDLFKYHGFHEDMLLGWHVDSNIAKRLSLVHGEVGDLGGEIFGYHCDHTRQVTAAHSHGRTENDIGRFFSDVETPTIPEQADTWGCVNDEVEEIYLGNRAQIYISALEEAIGTPLSEPIRTVYNGSSFGMVKCEPRHVIPFLADVFESLPRNITVAWCGTYGETLKLFAGIWSKLGFKGRIVVDAAWLAAADAPAVPGVQVVSSDEALAANVFIFDFSSAVSDIGAATRFFPFADAVDKQRLGFARVLQADRECIDAGSPPRRIICLNAIHNRFEGFVRHYILAAVTPFSGRMRHGFAAPVPNLLVPEVATSSAIDFTLGGNIDFTLGGNSIVYTGWGWSGTEGKGTWTEGPSASLTSKFKNSPKGDIVLELHARPFLVRKAHPHLGVEILFNNTVVDRWSYQWPWDNGWGVRYARIPLRLLTSGAFTLDFRIDRPIMPIDIGISEERRELGLMVSRISFRCERRSDFVREGARRLIINARRAQILWRLGQRKLSSAKRTLPGRRSS
jgi:hypothetical protein